MKSKPSISIMGCGWLGLPLAEQLIKKGFSVKGSITTAEKMEMLQEKNIVPFQIQVTETQISGDVTAFLQSDILIINFPPGRRGDVIRHHTAQMRLLTKEILKNPVKNVLFISSTSVYPELNLQMYEDETRYPSNTSGRALLEAERVLQAQKQFTTSIIRFAGMMGPDRHPGRFLAGKKNLENGRAPVNIIHRDDCIGVIVKLIEEKAWGEIFNACADVHPLRKDFYILAAQKLVLEPPEFVSGSTANFKIVNSDKIKTTLNYTFKYADPSKAL